MRAGEGRSYSNISADTATFQIENGGLYAILITGTFNGGNWQLQMLGPDGTTWIGMHTAISSNGRTTAVCGPGTYKFVESGTTSAMYIAFDRVPGE